MKLPVNFEPDLEFMSKIEKLNYSAFKREKYINTQSKYSIDISNVFYAMLAHSNWKQKSVNVMLTWVYSALAIRPI